MTISEKLTFMAFPLRLAASIAQKLLDKIDLQLPYVGRLGSRGKQECVYQFVAADDGRDVIFDCAAARLCLRSPRKLYCLVALGTHHKRSNS